MGRPTLLLIRDTADQALQDTSTLAEDLEDLLGFLQTPDSLIPNAAVQQKLNDWGPGLLSLSISRGAGAGEPGPAAAAATRQPTDHNNSLALVLAADGRGGAPHAAGGAAGGLDGLDPAAARRLSRQCAAKAASGLLGQLSQQLQLLEQCLAIVLLHFVQVGIGIGKPGPRGICLLQHLIFNSTVP
jgi:hypothetical protein